MNNVLELTNISKSFGSVKANKDISLTVCEGEVHAIVGENGAGKTTLMNILYGVLKPDTGTIKFKGQEVQFTSPHDAIKLGIGMVHQHFMLAENLTVAENITLGYAPNNERIWRKKSFEKAIAPIIETLGISLEALRPYTKVSELSVGAKQRIEIIKTLYRGAKVIIMDEPTATLTPPETKELFTLIRKLTAKQYTIIFITHKLKEIMEISDSITALRDGNLAGVAKTSEVDEHDIARMMIGRDLEHVKKEERKPGNIALKISGLTISSKHSERNLVSDFNLTLRENEILGIAGVEGNGQNELSSAIIGTLNQYSGTIEIWGQDVRKLNTRQRLNNELGYIPPDRMQDGVALTMSVSDNLFVGVHDKPEFTKFHLIDYAAKRRYAHTLIDEYEVKTESPDTTVGTLSGGNIQKVVIGRELGRKPKLVIANQPARGVDIGSAQQIRKNLLDIRDQGGAVLLISADLDEVMELSDRIIVIYEGRNVGEVAGSEATEERLGELMFGVSKREV